MPTEGEVGLDRAQTIMQGARAAPSATSSHRGYFLCESPLTELATSKRNRSLNEDFWCPGRHSIRDLVLEAAIAKLDKYHLLILDDLGYVIKDQAETSVLFELISARYATINHSANGQNLH